MKPYKIRPALKQLGNKRNLIGAEIGVYCGDYALTYLKSLDIKKVYLIDPYTKHKDYDEFTAEVLKSAEEVAHKKLKVYEDRIIWIKAKSAEVAVNFANESLDFVYIDGNHQCQFVLEDITLYYPKVKKGGLISGHDYRKEQEEFVFDAVNEFCEKGNLELNVSHVDWWIWK